MPVDVIIPFLVFGWATLELAAEAGKVICVVHRRLLTTQLASYLSGGMWFAWTVYRQSRERNGTRTVFRSKTVGIARRFDKDTLRFTYD